MHKKCIMEHIVSKTKYNTNKSDEENIKVLKLAAEQTSILLKDIEKVTFSKVVLIDQGQNFDKLKILAEMYNNLDMSFNKSLSMCQSLSNDLLGAYKKIEDDFLLSANDPKKLTSIQLSEAMLAISSKQKILRIRFIKHLEHKEQLNITKDFFEDLTRLPGNIDYGYKEFQKIIKQIQTNYEFKAYEELKHKKFSEDVLKSRKDNANTYLARPEHQLGFLEKLKRWLGFAKSKRAIARKTLKVVRDKEYISPPLPETVVDKSLSAFTKLQTSLETFSSKVKVAMTIQSAFRERLAKKKLDHIRADFDETDGKAKKAKEAQVIKLKRLIYEEYMTRYFVGMVLTHSDKITLQQNKMATLLGLIGSAADNAGAMGAGSMLTSVVADIIQNNRQQQAKDFAAFIENNRRSSTVEEMAKEVANVAAYHLQNSLTDVNIAELAKEFSHRASNNLNEIKKACKDLSSSTPKNFLKGYAGIVFNLSSSSGDQNIEHARNIQRLSEYRTLKEPRPLSNNYKTQIDLTEIKKISMTPDKHDLNVNAILFEIYKQSAGQLALDVNFVMQGAQAIATTATQTLGIGDKNLSKTMKPLLNEILVKRLEREGFVAEIYNSDQLKTFISKQDIELMLSELASERKSSTISLDQAMAKAKQPLTEGDINVISVLNNIEEQSKSALTFSAMHSALEKLVKKKLEEYEYSLDSSNPNEWKNFATKDDIATIVSMQKNATKYKGNLSVDEAIAMSKQQIVESDLDVEGILDALKEQSSQALKRKPMRKALEDLVIKKLKKAGVTLDRSTPEEWKKFAAKEDIEQMLSGLKKAQKFNAVISLDNAIESSNHPSEASQMHPNKKGIKSEVRQFFSSFSSTRSELSDSSSVSSDGHTDSSGYSSDESIVEKITRRKVTAVGKIVK